MFGVSDLHSNLFILIQNLGGNGTVKKMNLHSNLFILIQQQSIIKHRFKRIYILIYLY